MNSEILSGLIFYYSDDPVGLEKERRENMSHTSCTSKCATGYNFIAFMYVDIAKAIPFQTLSTKSNQGLLFYIKECPHVQVIQQCSSKITIYVQRSRYLRSMNN